MLALELTVEKGRQNVLLESNSVLDVKKVIGALDTYDPFAPTILSVSSRCRCCLYAMSSTFFERQIAVLKSLLLER